MNGSFVNGMRHATFDASSSAAEAGIGNGGKCALNACSGAICRRMRGGVLRIIEVADQRLCTSRRR
jgi:hypothetical protein